MGRSYHMIGVASRNVIILTLKPQQTRDALTSQTSQSLVAANSASRYDVRQVAQFDDHSTKIWRVSWNITGTILASTGDDGCVRLWKPNYLDSWKNVAVLKADGQTTPSASHPSFAGRSLNDTERVALDSAVSGNTNQARFFKSNLNVSSGWRP
ncbi:Nucleoporin SEH1-A [Halotydeus destructor]|nr:Nucleoporin SEH1-A [Halotydeus destructor]